MVRTRLFRLACVLTLLLLPTIPLAAVAQPGPAETLFTRLSTWWNTAWADAGCYIDPYGRCAPARSEPALSENGCYIDPNGGCAPEAPAPSNLDEGCYIDPYGGCRDRS